MFSSRNDIGIKVLFIVALFVIAKYWKHLMSTHRRQVEFTIVHCTHTQWSAFHVAVTKMKILMN